MQTMGNLENQLVIKAITRFLLPVTSHQPVEEHTFFLSDYILLGGCQLVFWPVRQMAKRGFFVINETVGLDLNEI